jgi:hypothetical protein
MKTKNIVTSHFMTNFKLSSKKEQWKYLLKEFYMTIEYRMGGFNVVTDSLSRKEQLTFLEEYVFPTSWGSQIHITEEWKVNIREGL